MVGKRVRKQDKACEPTVTASDAASTSVQLPADCRISAQTAVKAQLENVLSRGEIILDVAELQRVDTAALQLLVLFRRELEKQGGTLAWRGRSEVLDEAVSLLGLEQLLNLPVVTSA